MKVNQLLENAQPTLFVPISPSGGGKSTLYQKLKTQNPDLLVFSLDILRHEFYDPSDYAAAWRASNEDPQFKQRANDRFLELIKTGKDIYVDNTSLTPKRRRFYLNAARQHGYKTIAYVFDVDLPTLIARQKTRSDKSVPEEAVRQQYKSLVGPQAGEFDQVVNVK